MYGSWPVFNVQVPVRHLGVNNLFHHTEPYRVSLADREDAWPPAVTEAFAAAVAFSLPPGGVMLELNISAARTAERVRETGAQVSRLHITAVKGKVVAASEGQQVHKGV